MVVALVMPIIMAWCIVSPMMEPLFNVRIDCNAWVDKCSFTLGPTHVVEGMYAHWATSDLLLLSCCCARIHPTTGAVDVEEESSERPWPSSWKHLLRRESSKMTKNKTPPAKPLVLRPSLGRISNLHDACLVLPDPWRTSESGPGTSLMLERQLHIALVLALAILEVIHPVHRHTVQLFLGKPNVASVVLRPGLATWELSI